MLTPLAQWVRDRRLKRSRCPYCNQPFEKVGLNVGDQWLSAQLCPRRHYGITYEMLYDETGVTVRYKQLDWNGAEMPIPEENIKYDFEYDVGDED